jgi:hypothetical protein
VVEDCGSAVGDVMALLVGQGRELTRFCVDWAYQAEELGYAVVEIEAAETEAEMGDPPSSALAGCFDLDLGGALDLEEAVTVAAVAGVAFAAALDSFALEIEDYQNFVRQLH